MIEPYLEKGLAYLYQGIAGEAPSHYGDSRSRGMGGSIDCAIH